MTSDRNALQGVLNVTTVARARADGWDGTVTAAIASATHRSDDSFEYFDGLAEVRHPGRSLVPQGFLIDVDFDWAGWDQCEAGIPR